MRMVTHLHEKTSASDGTIIAVRYFTLECETATLRGVCISQVALTLYPAGREPTIESVDPDPELLSHLERREWRPLLDRLVGRYDGMPMGELAARAADVLYGQSS
ncbi:MAG: hypothetical protein MUF18_00955 [Fimbriiglobus sp.]|nr:hypothetical protein [Fimbriiglobus sp.]